MAIHDSMVTICRYAAPIATEITPHSPICTGFFNTHSGRNNLISKELAGMIGRVEESQVVAKRLRELVFGVEIGLTRRSLLYLIDQMRAIMMAVYGWMMV